MVNFTKFLKYFHSGANNDVMKLIFVEKYNAFYI